MTDENRICFLTLDEIELFEVFGVQMETLVLRTTLQQALETAGLACQRLTNQKIREIAGKELELLRLSHGFEQSALIVLKPAHSIDTVLTVSME